MPTVARASEFLDAFARLPGPQQRWGRDFTEKFQADPTSPAINNEKIHGVRDEKLRTTRIDWKYRAAYLKVPCLGCGRTLARPQRGRAGQVFERYRDALGWRHRRDWLAVMREARRLLEEGRARPPYRAAVADEAQGFHPEEWRLIRALAPQGPGDLFLVGDARQRIYGPRVSLARRGISIPGLSSRLRINFRTTEQIRAWAMWILADVEVVRLDEGRDDVRGY